MTHPADQDFGLYPPRSTRITVMGVEAPQRKKGIMGVVVSLLMIAAGAIMRYAVTVKGNGFNVGTVGMILMVVGAIGLVLSVAFWASWGGLGRFGGRSTDGGNQRTVVREREITEH